MIFLTVGHQMPFDRLVRAVDAWATATGRDDVLAQVGESTYTPRTLRATPFMSPADYARAIREADAIVAHAGTGTIIAAGALGKPLLLLPRHANLGETRNDHQVATARHFEENGSVLVAWSEDEVAEKMDALATFTPRTTVGAADPRLIERLRAFAFAA